MNITTYLRYNNVALIDPKQPFHATCIEHFNKKGFLSPKQLQHLSSWVHSVEAIARLTATVDSEPVEEPAVEPKSKRFSPEELVAIAEVVENNGSIEDLSKLMPNRSKSTLASTVCNFGGYTRKGVVIGKNEKKFLAYCTKRGLTIENTDTTPFD